MITARPWKRVTFSRRLITRHYIGGIKILKVVRLKKIDYFDRLIGHNGWRHKSEVDKST